MTLKVNGELIPPQAIEFELQRLVKFYSQHMSSEKIQEQMEPLRKKAREQAIGAKLLLSETERLDIRVPSEDVDERLKSVMEQSGGEGKFLELIQRQGLTLERVRAGIEKGRRVDLLIAKVTGEVGDPTEEELTAYYEAHAGDFQRAEMAQVQHVLIRPESESESDRATVRSRLQEIRQRLVDGADFSGEAAAHSECPSGRKTGGSLGWLSKGSMVPEIDRVVFAMKDGEISEVVETRLGMHIFKRVAHEDGGQASYTDVSSRIRDLLRHVRRGEAIAAYVEELKKKAVIEDD